MSTPPSEPAFSNQFGDIVLVRFPFTTQTASKQRPAVVVSNLGYNQARPDVVLMAVTSQLHTTLSAGDVWIANWHSAGLLKPSAIKPVFATIEQALIMRKLGSLEQPDAFTLRTTIATILG